MRKLYTQSVTAILTIFIIGCSQLHANKTEQAAPETKPAVMLLNSVETSDVAQFKTVWSEYMAKQLNPNMSDQYWIALLEQYKKLCNEEFGAYKISDFSFLFKGGTTEGEVMMTFKGNRIPALSVIKEGTEWKINER